MENLSDEQLITAYLEGDEQSLEFLFQRHLSPLYNFAFKYTHTAEGAQDVTQEAMVKIWKNLKKFRTNGKFKAWAYTITKNSALDYLKKKGNNSPLRASRRKPWRRICPPPDLARTFTGPGNG